MEPQAHGTSNCAHFYTVEWISGLAFEMIFLTFNLCTFSLSLSLPSCLGCQGVWWLILVMGCQAWALDGRFGCWAAELGQG